MFECCDEPSPTLQPSNLTTFKQEARMTNEIKRKIVLCSGTACTDPGGKRLEPELRRILAERGIEDTVEIE